MSETEIEQAVRAERARQVEKWGEQHHDATYWLGILVEEIGEVAKAVIEHRPEDAVRELVQVAAVALAMGCDLP